MLEVVDIGFADDDGLVESAVAFERHEGGHQLRDRRDRNHRVDVLRVEHAICALVDNQRPCRLEVELVRFPGEAVYQRLVVGNALNDTHLFLRERRPAR